MYALRKQKALSLLCVYDQTHALRDNGPGRRRVQSRLRSRALVAPPPLPRPVSASHALPFPLPSSDPLASKSRGDPPQVMAPATYRASQAMATPHDKKWGGMRLRRFRSSDLRHHGKQLTSPAESRKFPSPFSPLTLLRVHLCFSPHRH